jgi:protein-S-isoprenylcysteine O-methyltransferase Ste14
MSTPVLYSGSLAANTVLLCWLIWAVWWNVSARSTKPTAEKQDFRSRKAYLLITIFSFMLLFSDLEGVPYLRTPFFPRALADGGADLCVCGLLLTLWARHLLAGNWSGDVAFKQEHQLIEAGPYAFVRHPIYTGLCVMFFGSAIVAGTLQQLLAFVILLLSLLVKLRQEEVLLADHFPLEYPAYKKRTKALIPFLW